METFDEDADAPPLRLETNLLFLWQVFINFNLDIKGPFLQDSLEEKNGFAY